jgi:hypothetical protein
MQTTIVKYIPGKKQKIEQPVDEPVINGDLP